MTIELYQTPQVGELIDKIRVTGLDSTGKIAPYLRHVMLSIKLENIKPGDIIDIKSYGQVSNENVFSYNAYKYPSSAIMFCYGTILATGPSDTTGIEELTEFRGTNITKEIHHQPWFDGTHFLFGKNYPSIYINTVAYAATAALGPSSTPTFLKVDKDYARSSVMLFRMGV